MARRIGSTTYKVKVFFTDTGQETMEVLRIIRNDVLEKDNKYGIMDVPQMGRQSVRSA